MMTILMMIKNYDDDGIERETLFKLPREEEVT